MVPDPVVGAFPTVVVAHLIFWRGGGDSVARRASAPELCMGVQGSSVSVNAIGREQV